MNIIPIIEYICRCDWIEWKGSKYYQGDYVLCGFQEDDLPQFGKVYDILLAREEPFLCISVYVTKGRDAHYHSFVIVPSPEKRLIYVSKDKLLGTLHRKSNTRLGIHCHQMHCD